MKFHPSLGPLQHGKNARASETAGDCSAWWALNPDRVRGHFSRDAQTLANTRATEWLVRVPEAPRSMWVHFIRAVALHSEAVPLGQAWRNLAGSAPAHRYLLPAAISPGTQDRMASALGSSTYVVSP